MGQLWQLQMNWKIDVLLIKLENYISYILLSIDDMNDLPTCEEEGVKIISNTDVRQEIELLSTPRW